MWQVSIRLKPGALPFCDTYGGLVCDDYSSDDDCSEIKKAAARRQGDEASPAPIDPHAAGKPRTGLAYVASKLITKEDPFMIHKACGIFALCSFLYRYAYVWPVHGSLGLRGSPFDWFSMCVHLILSASSIQFRVPSRRMPRRPTMIWNEYRLHAIIFTTKAFCLFVLAGYSLRCGGAVRYLAYTASHLLADLVTHYTGSEGQTTIRGQNKTLNPFIYWMRRGYAFYQFLAYASMLTPSPRSMDLAYNTIIAIQSSAFMMTLNRKGLATWQMHFKARPPLPALAPFCLTPPSDAQVYSTCLAVSAAYVVTSLAQDFSAAYALTWTALVCATFYLRTCGVSKYAIWLLFSLAAAFLSGGADALTFGALFAFPRNEVLWRTPGRV